MAAQGLAEVLALTHKFVTSRPGQKYKGRKNVFLVKHGDVNDLGQKIIGDLLLVGIDLVDTKDVLATCNECVVFTNKSFFENHEATLLKVVSSFAKLNMCFDCFILANMLVWLFRIYSCSNTHDFFHAFVTGCARCCWEERNQDSPNHNRW